MTISLLIEIFISFFIFLPRFMNPPQRR